MTGPAVDRTPPAKPAGLPAFLQHWVHLSFLHWEFPAAALRPLLPAGLELDTYRGQAYVSLVPFTLRDVRPWWMPAVPWLSDFHEFTLRTYVLDPNGHPGVWFFSLDADSRIGVALGRSRYKLPCFYARMSLDGSHPGRYHCHSARMYPGAGTPGCDLTTTFSGNARPAAPGTLEHFLLERYFLFSHADGQLFVSQVWHRPYPFRAAMAQVRSESLLAASGLGRPAEAPLVHQCDGVRVKVYRLRRVAGRR